MAAKRSHGEGTWQRLPSGKWRLILIKDGEKISGPARETKPEARAALEEKLKSRHLPDEANLSFSIYLARWIELQQHHSPTTRDTYRTWLKSVERDQIGKLKVSQITSLHMKGFVSRLRQTGLAPATISKRVSWLGQMLRLAGNTSEIPKISVEATERRPLSDSELALAVEAFSKADERVRLAFLLCYGMGLRRGEACGLMHSDRDGDGVRISRTVLYAEDALHVVPRAKTARSKGWLPLPPFLLSLVGEPKTGFVLTGTGVPMHPKTLSWHFDEILKKGELGKIPFSGTHAFRRSFGMRLLRSGVDLRTASELMRHDAKMLLEEYTRSTEQLKREAIGNVWGDDEKLFG